MPPVWGKTETFMAILNIKNLPDGLYERLKVRAEQQHRSVAQEGTHILD